MFRPTQSIEDQWPEGAKRWKDACPLQQLGEPQEVAGAALFLACPQARWIRGSILVVDGGMSAGPGW
jgi:NAD(P)-dependent dehydrogenase (short-subunit alcohol dehydrogenase family)